MPESTRRTPRHRDPKDFLWGVATSAYQSEGGLNGGNQPRSNWAAAEEQGAINPLGRAADFWNRYEEDFERCRGIGLNAFRMGVSWSRLQPSRPEPGSPFLDPGAVSHYARILAACRESGMEPVLTLHHFTHPEWLGSDPWLDTEMPGTFARFTSETLRALNHALADTHGHPPIHYLITINEPNMLVLNSYFGNQFPARARRGFHNALRAYNGLLTAHVLAYNALHDLYEREGWEPAEITFNNYCSDLYWSDKLLLDLVTVRERGVERNDIPGYIADKARHLEESLADSPIHLHHDFPLLIGNFFKKTSNWLGARRFRTDSFRSLLDTLDAAPRDSVFDFIGLDYYDPFTAHLFRIPDFHDHEFAGRGLRSWMMNSVTSKWWDWRVLPRGLEFFCNYYSREYGNRGVLIAENGMAIRRRADNTAFPRRDNMTRSQFLRLHVHEVQRIVDAGTPLFGYLHWSLFDNYEWGSYTPRFGLYSIDYTRGTDRSPTDHTGDQPADTYARLIREARERWGKPDG